MRQLQSLPLASWRSGDGVEPIEKKIAPPFHATNLADHRKHILDPLGNSQVSATKPFIG